MNDNEQIMSLVEGLLKERRISQNELARRVNVSSSTMSRYFKRDREFPLNKVQDFAKALGTTSEHLLGFERIGNLEKVDEISTAIPVLGSIACGEPITAEENVDEYREALKSSIPLGNLFYLRAKGDSMSPKIPDGSYVLVREQSDVENGEIGAVLLNGDEEATLKRARKLGDSVLLESINEDYPPYLITDDNPARIIGKAVKLEVDL